MTVCDYCGKPAEKCTGKDIYPHRPDLWAKGFYRCIPCGAYVGCHIKSGEPFGRLANAELRVAKIRAHAAFDPLWEDGATKRNQAYSWLAKTLGIPRPDCHIGLFDLDLCRRTVEACKTWAPPANPTPPEAP